MRRLTRLTCFVMAVLLSACETPTLTPSGDRNSTGLETDHKGIDRLLLEAGRTSPPKSTVLKLDATELALVSADVDLAVRIMDSIESPYINNETTRRFSFMRAELALHQDDPELAIRLLEDPRLQRIRLTTGMQISAGKLRAQAYEKGRSYIASARELIYINNLIEPAARQKNHEKIFNTLLMLDEATLQNHAERSITSEIRGWLSLAAMTRRFQHDPLRQLNALKDWRKVWASHPAAVQVPSSLQMLSRIVDERPENIALMLPLNGNLAPLGRAIRDGYIAAHFELTPDTSVRVYDSSEMGILELTEHAITAGAELLIGPLDREKVTQLAGHELKVPVIALNRTLNGEINPNLYQFGLAPEDESRQVAIQVTSEDRFNGIIIAPDSAWGDRNFDAFTEQFLNEGGILVDTARYTDQKDYSDLVKGLLNVDSSEQRSANLRRIIGQRFEFTPRRRKDIDFIFLLASPTQARGINPTLAFFYAEDIPVYATSHVYVPMDSKINARDLNGIRFCDMPWKLSNSDSIQNLITDTWEDAATRFAPFYALGVDVHRLYPRLQQLKEFPEEKIFGSTGILTLNPENVINRTLMWAQFNDGDVSAVPMILQSTE